jgi:hypothetical protein
LDRADNSYASATPFFSVTVGHEVSLLVFMMVLNFSGTRCFSSSLQDGVFGPPCFGCYFSFCQCSKDRAGKNQLNTKKNKATKRNVQEKSSRNPLGKKLVS